MATRGLKPRQVSGVVVPFPKRHPDQHAKPVEVPASAPRYSRRLSDRILIAFHVACDGGELGIAELLLRCCETAMARAPVGDRDRRENDERLIAAFERLWFLRHPEEPPRQASHPDEPDITS